MRYNRVSVSLEGGFALKGIFDYDSPAMTFLRKAAELFVLNLLWLVCSLPVFTAGAATAALCKVSINNAAGWGNPVIDFFKYFRSNFRQATLLWLPAMVLGAALVFDWYFLFNIERGIFQSVGFLIAGAVSILYAFSLSFAFPLMVSFENSIFITLKNALYMSFANPLGSLILCVFNALPLLLIVFTDMGLWLLLIDVSLAAAADALFFRRIFELYTTDAESAGEEIE